MIRFIIDSTFGISKEFAKKENIKVVSLKMMLDGKTTEETYPDEWEPFYQDLIKSKNFPTSSQPNPQNFIDAIEEIYSEDENAEIIILTIAEFLSGTINSAKIATNNYPNKKIFAVDTGAVCACSVMMLEEMLDMAKKGKTFEEICEIAPKIKENLQILFVPSTMEYLKRGGRVGKLSACILDILKIKPIFRFINNKISVPKKSIGTIKAFSDAITMLPQKIKKISACFIYDKTHLPLLLKKLNEKINKKIDEFAVSPMFGVHVGVGSVGIATLSEY